MYEQMKSISQREFRKRENWIWYLRANKKVKEKNFKSFIRKKNLCVESNRPLYGIEYHQRKTKPQEIRKRQFQVKRLRS